MQQCDCTATYEFVVELAKFHNVDLFLRGLYSLQLGLKTNQNQKLTTKIEVISKGAEDGGGTRPATASAASTKSDKPPTPPRPSTSHPTKTTITPTAKTRTFRILFRNEEIDLNTIILFRVTINLDIKYLQEIIQVLEFKLELKLIYNDSVVSTRELVINLNNGVGINYQRPVFFDYFYLAALDLGVHGGLIALHLAKGLLLDNFEGLGCAGGSSAPSCVSSSSSSLQRLHSAQQLLLQILINANTNLRTKFSQLLKKESNCCSVKPLQLSNSKSTAEGVPVQDDDDWIHSSKQMSQLCAENILLWHKYLDTIIGKEEIRVYLSRLHHQARLERFTEGFYITKNPPRSALTPKDYTPIVELLKKSIIYKPLPLECLELDGDEGSIPLIFEDQYLKEGSVCNCLGGGTFKPDLDPPKKQLPPDKIIDERSTHVTLGRLTLSKSSTLINNTTPSSSIEFVTTLPRRHSEHRARRPGKAIRKYASTPLLNELEQEPWSEESGWVSDESLDSVDAEEVLLGIPPPKEFRDPPPPLPQKEEVLGRKKFGSLQYPSNTQTKRNTDDPPRPLFPFQIPDELRIFHPSGLHLIICVHGLDGSAHDLRLFKVYLEVNLPGSNLHFLMSEKNGEGETFSTFENMTTSFVGEVLTYIKVNKLKPERISFVGHSLGNVIVRAAVGRPEFGFLLDKLHTFLSLSGPHLGTLYNGAAVVNVGMWLMQKWKKSSSLLQLQLKDHPDISQTYLYKLSTSPNLQKFKNVLLAGSVQDRYVPLHSAHINNCKSSLKDVTHIGSCYRQMVSNIITPLLKAGTNLVRYDVHHCLQNGGANVLIGRAAHIAVLDSEIFIEKFVGVSCGRYFQ